MSFVFDQLTEKCSITIVAGVPNYKVKNKLNFRIHSVELTDGRIVRDPYFADSIYVFPIKNGLVGKKIQFNFSFLKSEIKNVKKFKIGFCDEMVRWLDSTILTFENTTYEHIQQEAAVPTTVESEIIDVALVDEIKQDSDNLESFLLLEKEVDALMSELSTEISIREAAESIKVKSDNFETKIETRLSEDFEKNTSSLEAETPQKSVMDAASGATGSNRKQRRNKKK